MKTLFAIALLTLTVITQPALAQAPKPAGDDSALSQRVAKLDQEAASLSKLSTQINLVSERDREALLYRRDERSFQLLTELDEISREAASLPEASPPRQEIVSRLKGDLAQVSIAVLERISELDERIAQFYTDLEARSGGDAVALEAYINSLKALRFKYNEVLVANIESRQGLGLKAPGLAQQVKSMLYLHAETLVGRLEFSDAARAELETRLGFDPENAELQATLNTINTEHVLYRTRLEATAALMERLEQDSSAYRAVLLKQGSGVSVETFKPNVMLKLLGEGWLQLRDAILENSPNIVFRALLFIGMLVLFRSLARLTRRLLGAALERSNLDISTLLKSIVISVSSGTVMAVGIMMALGQLGISLGPMLAGLGVAGFVVGFALQDTLGNFAAGGMILIYRPYDVDDFIEVAGASGLVRKMSLVSTTIATFDNQTLVVPNSKIWGDVIKNVTAQKVRRVDLEFGIGYDDDIEQAERVLADIVSSHEMVLKKPATLIKLHTLGDSSVNFVVRPWVRTDDYWDVYWDLTREVKMRFDREGISIPYPQRDVHLHQQS
jgi:small conductance mechanosensitive channel